MFHVEMRSGMHVVREFNLSERELWTQFLAPLMADHEFVVAGHDFIPRKTRIKIYEGPELRPDQLGMGRGWQNVERSAGDVTERVLARAREFVATGSAGGAGAPTPASAGGAPAGAPPATDALRERLIGRPSAGPVTIEEIVTIAADLMPESSPQERRAAAERAAVALLDAGSAQLAPIGR